MIDETFEELKKDITSNEFRTFSSQITRFEKIVLIVFGILFFASLFSLIVITIYYRSLQNYVFATSLLALCSIVLKIIVRNVTKRTK